MKKPGALASGYLVRRTSVFQYQPHDGDAVLGGHVVGAPSGVPAKILRIKESGRGKYRITRYLVEVDYAGRQWLAWIDPDNFSEAKQNPRKRRRMRKNPDDVTIQVVGSRVELHPGTDAWMRGDRYGEVIGTTRDKRRYKVRMDKSGKMLKVSPNNIYNIIGPAKNPKRRTRVQRRARVMRGSRGVIARLRFKPSRVKRGHLARTKENAYRRMMKTRRNPTARRASFVVSVRHGGEKDWRKNFHQIAAFNSKVQALDYARALARMNRRATIKVEKR